MNSFEMKLARLKGWLEVKTDTEAFEAMGLSRSELIERRKRRVFPGGAFEALCARRGCHALKPWVYYGIEYRGLHDHKRPIDYDTRVPTFDEMAAFMDAEMVRMGMAQQADGSWRAAA